MNAKNLTSIICLSDLRVNIFFMEFLDSFFIGIYGGFINAGIGIVIMLFLNRLNRFKFSQNKCFENSSLFLFILLWPWHLFAYNGAVDWKLGLLMALGTSLWRMVGKPLVCKKGGSCDPLGHVVYNWNHGCKTCGFSNRLIVFVAFYCNSISCDSDSLLLFRITNHTQLLDIQIV